MENKNNKCRILLVVNIVLLLVCGILIWKIYSYKEEVKIVKVQADERDALKAELDSLVAEHEKMKAEYGDMNTALSAKDSVIQGQIAELSKLMNNKVELNRLKRKMAALRRITQDYVRQIDSLVVQNNALHQENTKIKEDYKTTYNKNIALSKEKDELSTKVNNAAVLKAFNVQGVAVKMKKRGQQEEITDKARRGEKIKVSFTLLENSLIASGNKNIYVRIARPDGEILSKDQSDQYSFKFKGEQIQYSAKEIVNYDQKNTKVTVYWQQAQEYTPGLYEVDIFSDEGHIGKGSFKLE